MPIDDRRAIRPGDRILLIVEDDVNFAPILLDMARERGFRGVIAGTAEEALRQVRTLKPHAITLDLRLPDGDGWSILDRLKHDPTSRHIPVHVISVDEDRRRGLRMGALAFLQKPATREALEATLAGLRDYVDRKARRLLIVEDNEAQRNSLVALVGNGDVVTTAVATGADALAALQKEDFDCVVLDLGLPDMTGFELIEKLRKVEKVADLPIIVYTGRDLTRKEERELHRLAEAVVIKDVKSPERMLDETALFLHRVEANLPAPKRQMLDRVHQIDPVLTGRKILVVDDDMRNIFSLTAILEQQKIVVRSADGGQEALDLLKREEDVDLILMGIMMPDMDGYETMKRVRAMPKYKKHPIIALTAKAMKGDREKCLEAGASDYIAKPVDKDQLLSLMRVWLFR